VKHLADCCLAADCCGQVFDALREYVDEHNESEERNSARMRENAAEKIKKTHDYKRYVRNKKRRKNTVKMI